MKTATPTLAAPQEGQDQDCRHHWLLGQPQDGSIAALCRKCGGRRVYPAVLDDLDPGIEIEPRRHPIGVATAAGGARPSSGAQNAPGRQTQNAARQAQDRALLAG